MNDKKVTKVTIMNDKKGHNYERQKVTIMNDTKVTIMNDKKVTIRCKSSVVHKKVTIMKRPQFCQS